MINDLVTLHRTQRSLIYVCGYLGALFLSIVVMWWMVLVGDGNPYATSGARAVDAAGKPKTEFVAGDIVGILRQTCAERVVHAAFHPTLRSESGLIFPLPAGMVESAEGCGPRIYGFIMPALPPGNYFFSSVIRFQSNLVGRDEFATFPATPVRVVSR